jgi:hypothetical protein
MIAVDMFDWIGLGSLTKIEDSEDRRQRRGLMLCEFCGMETRVARLRCVCFELIQDGDYT